MVNRVAKLLHRHLPHQGAFVNRFLQDRGHGILHGERVFNIANEVLALSGRSLQPRDLHSLELASMLHDIADIKNPKEYQEVFSGHHVTHETLSPVLAGLKPKSTNSVHDEIEGFTQALSSEGKLRQFHHLTGALFAYDILFGEQNLSPVQVAQAILFHSERKLEFIPKNIVVRLLRDADKIEGLDLQRLIDINTKAGRIFFDPSIPFILRKVMLSGRIRPEEQEARDPKLKLDTFQFAGVRSLFLDTNPDMYALPDLANAYLRKYNLFSDYLGEIIAAAEKYNHTPQLLRQNLEVLAQLLSIAEGDKKYAANADLIVQGKSVIEQKLNKRIDSAGWSHTSIGTYFVGESMQEFEEEFKREYAILKSRVRDLGYECTSKEYRQLEKLRQGNIHIDRSAEQRWESMMGLFLEFTRMTHDRSIIELKLAPFYRKRLIADAEKEFSNLTNNHR